MNGYFTDQSANEKLNSQNSRNGFRFLFFSEFHSSLVKRPSKFL